MRPVHYAMIAAVTVTAACGGSSTGPRTPGTTSKPPTSGSVVDVTIQDFSFSPAAITVKAGTTVRWTNRGPSSHTTTSNAGLWDSQALNAPTSGGAYGGGGGTAGGSFQFTFAQAGTFPYHCTIHPPALYPNFTGVVTVTQ